MYILRMYTKHVCIYIYTCVMSILLLTCMIQWYILTWCHSHYLWDPWFSSVFLGHRAHRRIFGLAKKEKKKRAKTSHQKLTIFGNLKMTTVFSKKGKHIPKLNFEGSMLVFECVFTTSTYFQQDFGVKWWEPWSVLSSLAPFWIKNSKCFTLFWGWTWRYVNANIMKNI